MADNHRQPEAGTPLDAVIDVEGEEIPPAPDGATLYEPARSELAVRPQGSTALIVADSAAEKLAIASDIATALDDVIKTQGLRTKVGRRKVVQADGTDRWEDSFHVNVEAWQTLATLLGLAVVPVWARRVRGCDGRPERITYPVKETRYRKRGTAEEVVTVTEYEVDGYSWEARVEVYKDGSLIGAGEAMCGRAEDKWKSDPDHALKSMAQTRATGKAVGGAARWIVTLAGYCGTPAEELPPKDQQPEAPTAMPASQAAETSQALTYLVGHEPTAERVWDKLKVDGSIPKIAADAIALTARAGHAVNDQRSATQATNAAPPPSGEQQGDAQAEPQGEDESPAPGGQLGALMRTGGYEQATVQALCELLFDASSVEALEELELRQLCELLKTARAGVTHDGQLARATVAGAQQQDRAEACQRLRRWLVERAQEQADEAA